MNMLLINTSLSVHSFNGVIISSARVCTLQSPLAPEFLCISVLRVASGPRVNLVNCKSALTSPSPPPLGGLHYWPF